MLDYDEIVRGVGHSRLVSYFNVASVVILFYDIFVTIGTEVDTIWSSRWRWTKVLYLFTRYSTFVEAFVIIYEQTIPGTRFKTCALVFKINAWLFIVGLGAGEMLLTLRTWAVLKSPRKLGIALASIWLLVWAGGFVVVGLFLQTIKYERNDLTPYVGCHMTEASEILFLDFVLLLFYDTMMLTLISIPAFKEFRRRGGDGLVNTVYRDGVIYYSYMFALSLINIVVILTSPRELITLLSMMERVLHAVFTCRVVLHIRKQQVDEENENMSTDVPTIRFKKIRKSAGLTTDRTSNTFTTSYT